MTEVNCSLNNKTDAFLFIINGTSFKFSVMFHVHDYSL